MARVTGEQLLSLAARDIGYREGAGKANKFGEWYGMNGVAWCMEAVQYWYAQAGAPLPFKTASCGTLLRWYQQNQPECVVKDPVPGCIVIFDFPGTAYNTDHTGLFVKLDGGKITTIDGIHRTAAMQTADMCSSGRVRSATRIPPTSCRGSSKQTERGMKT